MQQETWIRPLGQEDLLEKEVVTHSSILAWEIQWTEEHGRLHYNPWGCKEQDMTEHACTHMHARTHTHISFKLQTVLQHRYFHFHFDN